MNLSWNCSKVLKAKTKSLRIAASTPVKVKANDPLMYE
jgi:hypothetical protein